MRSLRPTLLVVLVLFLWAPLYSQGQTTQSVPNVLTNSDVIEMLKAGLSQEIVIAKIRTSACDFDTSPATLKQLKAAHVPDGVILAIVQAPPAQHTKQNDKYDSIGNRKLSMPKPEAPAANVTEEHRRPATQAEMDGKVYAECGYGPIGIHSDAVLFPTVAIVVCGDTLTVLGETNGGPGKTYLKVRTQGGIEGYVLANLVSKTKTEIGQIDTTERSAPASLGSRGDKTTLAIPALSANPVPNEAPTIQMGRIKGTLTYFFNSNLGDRPDTGSELWLIEGEITIPADQFFLAVNDSLSLGQNNFKAIKHTAADGNGNFEISDIPAGRYTLVMQSRHTNGTLALTPKEMVTKRDAGGRVRYQTVQVEPGKTVDASLDFGPTVF